jgi:hypothetical protein
MSCFILGDSIAEGILHQLKGCQGHAVVGAPSNEILHFVPDKYYDEIIISAGSNDAHSPHLPARLKAIRDKVRAGHVVWIRPAIKPAADAVEAIAKEYEDHCVPFIPGHDGVHPRSYAIIAAFLRHLTL